jgi:RimJ/RimL family protein N-acetyltransferase
MELATERLVLERQTLDDFEDSFAMWSNPTVTRFIGGRPSTREEAWARLLRNVGHWQLLHFGYWAVRERASGAFVGEVGFADFRREMEPRLMVPEAGWVLAPTAFGKGYATEAVRAALAWADERFAETACIIDVDHRASIHVAEKCGYANAGRASYKGEVVELFRRRR